MVGQLLNTTCAPCAETPISGRRAREALLRDVLAPLLEQQLRGLLLTTPDAPAPTATSGLR